VKKTVLKNLYYAYRLDYVIYILTIIILDSIALYYPNTYFYLIPVSIVWLQMLVTALKMLKKKQIGTEFFLVFATIIALIGKQQHAIIIVLLLMLIAQYIELIIELRTKSALESLIHLIPSQVTLLQDDREKIVPLEQLTSGMDVMVKTGWRIPADGFIIQGHATINEAVLTGESMPVEKTLNDHVFAGTFVEAGSIIFKVQAVKQETLFGKMTALFAQAEQKKARITILTEKIAAIMIPTIITFIIGAWLITGNLNLVVTLLIFGSPLELSLVTPLTVLAGTVAAFRHGVLVRGGRALEQFAQIDTLIFDKTGTLTLGEPTVVNIVSYSPDYTTSDILKIAGIAEIRSDHVVSKAILKKAKELSIEIPQPENYASLVGHGVEISYKNKKYFLGNRHFIEASEHGHSPIPIDEHHDQQPHSHFYLASQGNVIGKISVMDTIRPDAKETIQKLKKSGIKQIILISGDRQAITNSIAKQLGITEAYGEAFPEQKLQLLDQLQQQGKLVGMVGDGINDVAALKQAHVGIAMGAMGMEPAIEAADIVLMTNDLSNIFFMRKLSQKVFKVIKENLLIGFFILHIIGLILTLMQLVDPIQAAFFHALSDILILLNASRLITFKIKEIL
jgi:heavy metal translocating P-type ATPase